MEQSFDRVKAIIFDMDGVIFDTEMVYLKVWSKVFEKYGYKMTKEIYTSVLGTGRENVKKTFLMHFGAELPIEDMYKEKDEELAKEINKGVPIKLGVYDLLLYLKSNNYKMALATSAMKERAYKQLRQASIERFFDVVICRDDVKKTKPNPEIFLKAADKLEVKIDECIVIEDSSSGVEAAFKGGFKTMHVVDLKEADEHILRKCYKSFNNLKEIKEELIHINFINILLKNANIKESF